MMVTWIELTGLGVPFFWGFIFASVDYCFIFGK